MRNNNKPNINTDRLNQYDSGIKKWAINEIKKRRKKPNNPNSPILLDSVLNIYFLKKIPYPKTDNKLSKTKKIRENIINYLLFILLITKEFIFYLTYYYFKLWLLNLIIL